MKILNSIKSTSTDTIFIKAFIMLFSIFCSIELNATTEEVQLITSRIQTSHKNVKIANNDASTTSHLQLLQNNGAFSDINYADKSETGWQPQTHLDRLKPMVISFSTATSSYYNNSDLYTKIVAAFQYWQDSHPLSTNWYMQEIASPQRMGILLLIMRTAPTLLPTNLENALINRMVEEGGDPANKTGANKMDVATHWIYRGCLTGDETVLKKGADEVYDPLQLVTDEGIQHDYSYQQHQSQLYIGGYGRVLINGISNLAIYMYGTSYGLTGEKLNIYSRLVRETYIPSIRGSYLLFNVLGRSIARSGALSESSFVSVLNRMKNIDPDYTSFYNKTIERISGKQTADYDLLSNNTHYWRSDYTRHQRKNYTIDTRMASVYTMRSENGNKENLKGYFLVDGATTITQRGDEYVDIFPVWDWSKIPGTTTPERTSIPKPAEWGTAGSSFFAGGASDGEYGVSAYMYDDQNYNINTKAKKSWFFFDDEVVCLGAGITSSADENITTTINQSLLNGDVGYIASNNVSSVFPMGGETSAHFSWILHDGIGYYFPAPTNVTVSNKAQTGSWYSINNTQSTTELSKNVFKAWINHGNKPYNHSYAYFIVPNKKNTTELTSYDASNIEILANSDSLQVVRNKSLDILGVVFYKAASFSNSGFSIKSDEACIVLLRNITSDNIDVYVADPSRRKEEVSFIIEMPQLNDKKRLVCSLPSSSDPYAGSTQKYKLDNNTPTYVPDETYKIYAQTDAYVRNGFYSTTNYKTSNTLEVAKGDENFEREAYIKFDLKDLNIEELQNKDNLKIYLNAHIASTEKDIYKTNWNINYVYDNDWTESSIKWDNRPFSDYLVETISSNIAGNEIQVDVTNCILSEWSDTHKEITFQISATTNSKNTDAAFYSRRAGQATSPYLLFKISSSLGINNETSDGIKNNYIKVYPSVVKVGETLNIEVSSQFDGSAYESNLFSQQGVKILSTKDKEINTNNLSSGTYIFVVTDQNNSIIGRQIIFIK